MSTRRQILMGAAAAGLAASASVEAARAAPGRRLVQTVLGPIDASKLGFTLPHEHLVSSSPGMWRAWPELFGGRTAVVAKAVDRLKALKDDGVSTIVDLTTFDLGRDVRLMQEVSRKTGIQIVPCTGHWLFPTMSMSARTVEELTDFFLREIERGIEDTDIRAGVIKVATDKEGVTPFIEMALRAAARASKATGTPIETHTLGEDRSGLKQAEIFEAEGLDPAKVSIGHSDDSTDMGYLTGLIRRGYTVGLDHMSRGVTPPGQPVPKELEPYLWENKAARIKALVDAGHASRIFLSNDWLFADSLFPTGTVAILDSRNPDGICFLTRKVIPHLRTLGVSEQAIQTMTVDNPRRFFGG